MSEGKKSGATSSENVAPDVSDTMYCTTDSKSFNKLLKERTVSYLDYLAKQRVNGHCQFLDDSRDDYVDVEAELLHVTNVLVDEWNEDCDKADREKRFKHLAPVQIAECLIRLENGCLISSGEQSGVSRNNGGKKASAADDPDKAVPAFYIDDVNDPNYGIYVASEGALSVRIRKYNYQISDHDIKETLRAFRDIAELKYPTTDRDLIPVNNGVFHYRRKELLDYDRDVVFLAKSHIDYVENARNIVIHNDEDGTDWDVESWFSDLSDDPGVVSLLWQVVGAIVRPFVSWNKSIWFYSDKGNNGKGTLCELMRNLLGDGTYTSMPLADFAVDSQLERIVGKNAIITDENDVGRFLKLARNFKAAVTHDVLSFNRKYKMAISYRFHGLVVECFNDNPRVGDMSDSFYRRIILITMPKLFTGCERKYIKEDYIARQEVLEYVLCKVLNTTDFYEFSVPASCEMALDEMKVLNDPVRQFFEELEEEALWDLLPWAFVQNLFTAWYRKNNASGHIPNWKTAKKRIQSLAEESSVFAETGTRGMPKQSVSAGHMDCPELLIAKYHVEDWSNKYNGGDPVKESTVSNLARVYRGLVRIKPLGITSDEFSNAGNDPFEAKKNALLRLSAPVEDKD